MARRNGRPGNWLATDDLTGFTVYGSKLKRGYYGELAVKPFKRNLQEIASPLDDPTPVPIFNGPQYETSRSCLGEVAPAYVGNTTVPTNPNNAAFQVLRLNPSLGEMSVGCSFVVR